MIFYSLRKVSLLLVVQFLLCALVACSPRQNIDSDYPNLTPTAIQVETETINTIPSEISTPQEQEFSPEPTEVQLPIEIPVLVMAYYPRDKNNPENLDYRETNLYSTVDDMQQYVAQLVEEGARIASEGTRYHGYKDPDAPMYLEYQIIQKLEFFEQMPRGVPLDNSSRRPYYAQIFRDQQICDYVDRLGVREIWIYGYHSNTIVPDESKMSSIYGDVSNALPHDEDVETQYKLPICDHSYVMYNFNYGREIETNIHNRMHQIENVVSYAENRENKEGSLFWDDFSFWGYLGSKPGYKASCGNAHSAPNSVDDYMYTSREMKENNCETWNPDDSKTTYVLSDCSQWGCTEMGFYIWYMQNMPGYHNGIQYQGKWMRNWWDAMADFNQFIAYDHSLYTTESNTTGNSSLSTPGDNNIPENTPIPPSTGDFPIFEYPKDQQVLDYGENYMFKVEPYLNAEYYLWGFIQNGEVVWENQRDEGVLSSNAYNILKGSAGHSKLEPGTVEVWVRAFVDGKYTEPGVITIYLRTP